MSAVAWRASWLFCRVFFGFCWLFGHKITILSLGGSLDHFGTICTKCGKNVTVRF